jgi:DNA-directed RNA polymerase specialized sigma subunit
MASKSYEKLTKRLRSSAVRAGQKGSAWYQKRHTPSAELLQLWESHKYVLRKDQQFIFEAFYFEKRSTSDIANQLGKSPPAVVIALKRINQALESGVPSKLYSKGKGPQRYISWDLCKKHRADVGQLIMRILERRFKHHLTNKEIAAEFDLSEAETSMIAMVFGRYIRKLSDSSESPE